MTRLVYAEPENFDPALHHADDALRLVGIAAGLGYYVAIEDAHNAWEGYSADMAASWMVLGSDDERAFRLMRSYLVEVPS